MVFRVFWLLVVLISKVYEQIVSGFFSIVFNSCFNYFFIVSFWDLHFNTTGLWPSQQTGFHYCGIYKNFAVFRSLLVLKIISSSSVKIYTIFLLLSLKYCLESGLNFLPLYTNLVFSSFSFLEQLTTHFLKFRTTCLDLLCHWRIWPVRLLTILKCKLLCQRYGSSFFIFKVNFNCYRWLK